MVTSGWKEAGPVLRVVWKFASMENGGLCVMTHGMMTIPVWSVDSLVSHEVVRRSLNSCQLHTCEPNFHPHTTYSCKAWATHSLFP